ncbi:MAG: helix-turn-helix domain-containing protein [Clostridiales bacterium]|nr:helix-turn-helix domain-containing protein [Clostridiales bacterium]
MKRNIEYWTSERFFKRLDFFLKKSGLSFIQLSRLSETSISSIYQIRRRKALPNFQTLCAVCDALNIELWQFFDSDDKRTVEMEQVVLGMKNVSKNGQKMLAKFIEYIK